MRRSSRAGGAAFLVAFLSGCAFLLPGPEAAADDAHVVFRTDPGCAHVIVKTQGDRFGILRPVEPMTPVPGDIFVGALRPGTVALGFLPFPEQDLRAPVSVEVHSAGLVLADAQSMWRELCAQPMGQPTTSDLRPSP